MAVEVVVLEENGEKAALKLTNLLYHDVVRPGEWRSSGFRNPAADSYKIERGVFDRHLDLIAQVERLPAVAIQDALASDTDQWTLSVDDGGVTALTEIAPALEAKGWVGHFFITTGKIGEPGFVDADQIKELVARGHVVGTHTVSHPTRMARLPYDEAVSEWSRSRRHLEDILGTQVVVGSVPGGAYIRNTAEAAAEAGLQILFNSEPQRGVDRVGTCQVVGRFCVKRSTPDAEVAGLVTGSGGHRLRHWTTWNAKKLAKRVAWPLFRGAQRVFHSKHTDHIGP